MSGTKAGNFDWTLLYAGYKLEKQGKLSDQVRGPLMSRAAEVLAAALTKAEPAQKPTQGAWVYDDAYQPVSSMIGLACDLLGSAKGETGLAELRRAAKLTDEHASAFAAGSLVQRGEKVESAVIERICAGAIGWGRLVPRLAKAKQEGLVPQSVQTLEAAARANMVTWLVYPTELGREPEEIALVKSFDAGEGAEAERYYIFKFRSDADGFKEKGWMMGLSGPFDAAKPFTQPAGRHTFSRFEPIGKGTGEEQANEIIEQVKQAQRERAKKGE
ncbi:MAG: hypothetical protein QM783_19900 [Phycisphaerales bacterium]